MCHNDDPFMLLASSCVSLSCCGVLWGFLFLSLWLLLFLLLVFLLFFSCFGFVCFVFRGKEVVVLFGC